MVVLGLFYLISACWIGLPPCSPTTSYGHAKECQGTCERRLVGITGIRVWAAGSRTGPNQFCQPCSMFGPTLLLESTAAPDIDALRSALSFSWAFDGPRVAMCGPVTVDFLRGQEIALSLNLRGDLAVAGWPSGWSAPLSRRSRRAVDRWMEEHGVWEKVTKARSGR